MADPDLSVPQAGRNLDITPFCEIPVEKLEILSVLLRLLIDLMPAFPNLLAAIWVVPEG
jgi:hypothetical protein